MNRQADLFTSRVVEFEHQIDRFALLLRRDANRQHDAPLIAEHVAAAFIDARRRGEADLGGPEVR